MFNILKTSQAVMYVAYFSIIRLGSFITFGEYIPKPSQDAGFSWFGYRVIDEYYLQQNLLQIQNRVSIFKRKLWCNNNNFKTCIRIIIK